MLAAPATIERFEVSADLVFSLQHSVVFHHRLHRVTRDGQVFNWRRQGQGQPSLRCYTEEHGLLRSDYSRRRAFYSQLFTKGVHGGFWASTEGQYKYLSYFFRMPAGLTICVSAKHSR